MALTGLNPLALSRSRAAIAGALGGQGFSLQYLLEVLPTRAGAPTWNCATGSYTALTGQALTQSGLASGGYCLGRDGLLHWTAPNTLTYSNTFSNGAWIPDGTTVAQNAVGPDGASNSAWTLTATAGVGQAHRIYQSSATSGKRQSIYAKIGGGTANAKYVGLYSGGAHTATSQAAFDLSNGTIAQTYHTPDAAIESVGNGWYRLSITGDGSYFIVVFGPTANDACGDNVWTSDGSDYVLLAQGQVNVGATAAPYLATTSTSVAPVRVEPSGLLVEPAATNYVAYSNTFTNANWNKDNASVAQNATGPDGVANSAWTWTASGGATTHRLYQPLPVGPPAVVSTASVYLKAGTAPYVGLSNYNGDHNYAVVDMSNGTIVATGGTYYAASSVDTLANGWYRLNVSKTATGGSTFILLCPGNAIADCIAGGQAWIPAGTETVLVWQMDLCTTPFATSPIPTTSVAVTRNDDIFSVHNPLSDLGQPVPNYRFAATAIPLSTWAKLEAANGSGVAVGVLSWGANDGPNSMRLIDLFNPNANINIWDAAAVGVRSVNTTNTFTGSTTVSALCTVTNQTAMTFSPGSVSLSGSGTGVATIPSGLALGHLNNSFVFSGHLRDIYADGANSAPGAPTGATAVAGNASATVSWTAPAMTGGYPITSYVVTSSPATTPQTLASGGTFTGLTNGVAYTFTVQAVNSVGTSAASAASNSVTPVSFSYPTNAGLGSTDATTYTAGEGLTFAQDFTAPNSDPGYTGTNDGSNGFHIVGTGAGTSEVKFGFAAKAGTNQWAFVNQSGIGSWAIFNLGTGAVDSVGGGSAPTASVTNLGGGYYWCETVFPFGVNNVKVGLADTQAHAATAIGGSRYTPTTPGNALFYHFASYA